jgi:hypothetical protein
MPSLGQPLQHPLTKLPWLCHFSAPSKLHLSSLRILVSSFQNQGLLPTAYKHQALPLGFA